MAGSKSKWLKGIEPEEPLEEAARQAIDNRLDRVWHYLSLAVDDPQGPAENVHQLRVWSRRGAAALSLFESLLPKQRARWINKTLKHVRRAAGSARDLDVLAARLAALAQKSGGGPYQTLYEVALRERQAAQEPISEIYGKLKRKGFRRRQSALLERVHSPSEGGEAAPTYADAARAALKPLAEEFLSAIERPSRDYAVLHALRIKGKELRYAIELFAGALDPYLREQLYPQIASLQDRLGEINDHATACEHLLRWGQGPLEPAMLESLTRMIAEEQQAMDQSRQAFVDGWTRERHEQLRSAFRRALDAPAPRSDQVPA